MNILLQMYDHVARNFWELFVAASRCLDFSKKSVPFGNLLQNVHDSGEENLLANYQKHWQEYSKGSRYLNQLYG